MTYTVQIKPAAAKQLAKLDRPVQRRIQAAIALLADNPRPPGAEVLTVSDGLLRVRTGNYRIVYSITDAELFVLVVKIGHRSQIYRQL